MTLYCHAYLSWGGSSLVGTSGLVKDSEGQQGCEIRSFLSHKSAGLCYVSNITISR